ncbi:MAG: 7-cyano-7-deazaguanine synthase [Candidatus Omnitrophota bacterium]
MNKKAVALFSGGLDSMLAIRLMLEQGIEIHALHFYFVFTQGTQDEAEENIKRFTLPLNVPVKIIDGTEEMIGIIRNPRYAVGKNINPCIDCRIFTLKKARQYMDEIGASFIVTGEVLGERPLSQRLDALKLIDRESGLEGLILRPLSAKLLNPTEPEKQGIINRDRLMDISGRRRVQQLELAKKFGINEYQTPAGGCLLTDKGFSARLRDLFQHNSDSDINNLRLLRIGRHFRISDRVKFIVGRDEKENNALLSLALSGDYIFDIPEIPSAIGIARGAAADKDIEIMASILARYSDLIGNNVKVSYKILPNEEWKIIPASPADKNLLESIRI